MSLGEKSVAVLEVASLPFAEERIVAYREAAKRYTEKAVMTKFNDLARRGYIDFGVAAPYGWLTEKGVAALKEAKEKSPAEAGREEER